jgi:HK97 family phage portal protein
MRSIKKVAGPIASVPMEWELRGEDVELPELEAFWAEPAEGLGWSDFVEASVGWLKLAGEFFWVMDDTWLAPLARGQQPGRLIVARPDRMEPVRRAGQLVGWRYTDGDRRQHVLLPEQVIHGRGWNPYDDIRGLSEYSAARIAVESDYAAGLFARTLMQNNGDTGPFLVPKAGTPSPEQVEQIISQLRMKRDLAARGEYRPMFLSADIAVEESQIKAPDATFVANRMANRHEIALAFGVPPSMLDKMESYSIGSASDWYILINETCIPTGAKLMASVSRVGRRLTGEAGLRAYLDWDDHPVMQAVRRERIDAALKLWGAGMPMSEANAYLGLGMQPYEGWETGYLPFSVAPAGATREPAVAGEFAEPEVEEARAAAPSAVVRAAAAALRAGGEADDDGAPCCGCGVGGEETAQKGRDPREVEQWRAIVARRLATIKAYRSKFDRVLFEARAEVLRKLEGAKSAPAQRAGVAADFMFDLGKFSARLRAAMRAVALTAVQDAGDQALSELGKDDPWAAPPAEVQAFVAKRENRLSGVPQEVYERIKAAIQARLDEGATMDEIARAVRAECNAISDGRGKVIAQTETAAAYGWGRHEAMRSAGVTHKRWLTSGNDNVRRAHQAINGVTVAIDEPFVVINENGEVDEVMHPGDPDGAPWNVINCHCVEVAVRGKETEE